MKPRYWFRWLVVQGAPRLALKTYSRRGEVLARLMSAPDAVHDPIPLLESLRAQGRLVRTPLGWATADHELCRTVLRDNTFGVAAAEGFVPKPLRRLMELAELPPNPVSPPSMLVIDPPDHTRMRKPVASAFTPRAIGRLRERVESVTAELLDALPSDGSADLVAAYASQVPIAIISEMLGFPDRERERFLAWGDAASPLLDIGTSWRTTRTASAALLEMDRYLDEHIARLRREPGEDILSGLVTAGELDDRELKASATLLMGAGFETTVNLISNGVVQLLAHPEQLARLRAEPDLWPNAVEEILRFDAPVQSTARIAGRDVELAGTPVRAGSTVVLLLAGANRDPAVFTDPDRFDIGRANAKDHLTFSSGIHVCLGASLARMEGTHALRSLFERFPHLQLAGEPQRRPLFTLHGYSHLPVLLGHRAKHPAPV
ncbi:cytochrome P450 [Nocardia blacklockiae]|uniref:cytochrome P450 n=1 Tax=Nocardia blacklockiae TaxID=480036 RepID=UPI0018957B06|nr:cytochrome P450 [Nocardia blacklockiae]MBF6174588.1 cytochrome P450 [Nocardia blacklockiae]